MEVLFLIVNKTEYLDDILSGFMKAGIRGATILESQGMGSALVTADNHSLPLLGAFKSLLEHNRPYNKVVFTVLEKEMTDKAIAVVEGILGDMTEPGVGMMFTLPIGRVFGQTKRD